MGTKLEISKVRQENLQLYAHATLQNISVINKYKYKAGTIIVRDVSLFGICTVNAPLVIPDNTNLRLRQKIII